MNYKLLFSTFTIFYTTFCNIVWSNPTLAGWISNGCTLLFLVINREIFKYAFSGQYKWTNICAFLFAGIIVYSGYVNANLSFDVISWDGGVIQSISATRADHALYAGGKFIMFLLFIQHLNRTNLDRLFLKYLLYFFAIYTVISDINALIYNSTDGDGYLVGNKFSASYNNLYLTTLYYMHHPSLAQDKRTRRILKSILFLSLLVAFKTECSTAVIGTILLYILIFHFKSGWKQKLYKYQTYLLLLFVCDILFFFFTTAFINTPIMEFIIVDLLGEDMTLTGRLNIYATLVSLLQDCPLWGYGLGNAHLFTMMNDIGSNAQNGFFNLMLEVGLLGCIVYFILLLKTLKTAMYNINSYPIVCFIYTMLILSAIEITFSVSTMIMSMFVLLNNKQQSKVEFITTSSNK